jgi:WD40 repeat protein
MTEVALIAFDTAIHIVSLSSGQLLSVLKSSDSTAESHHALDVSHSVVPHCDKALQGRAARIVLRSCHVAKALVHSFSAVQFLHRSPVPEALAAVRSSQRSRAYVVGGGASGQCHLWDAHSGELLRSWPAHYRKCGVVAFSDGDGDDALVVTGGDDAIVNVWSLAQLLRTPLVGRARTRDVAPLRASSAHALPITDLVVRNAALGHVYSASLDRTVKLWHLESDSIVLSVVLPSAIHCLALSPSGSHLYAGLENGDVQVVALDAEAPAADGGGAAGVTAFSGHEGAVTTLALSVDGTLLVSGARDAVVRVWDTVSGQTLRTHSAKGTPFVKAASTVCAVRLLLRPRIENTFDAPLTAIVTALTSQDVAVLKKYARDRAAPSLIEPAGMTEFELENRVECERDERDELTVLDDDDAQHELLLRLTATRVALYENVGESAAQRIERLEAELLDARNEARRWRMAAGELFEMIHEDS